MVRRQFTLFAVGGLLLTMLFVSTQANAAVRFVYTGGRWSHSRHAGWHRYWGGPSIGFYYSSAPVYIVRGYDDPYYYRDSEFWYSEPSFGLSLSFGGGGYYRDYGYRDRYYTVRDRGYRSSPRYSGHSDYVGSYRDRGSYRVSDHSSYGGRSYSGSSGGSYSGRSGGSYSGRSGGGSGGHSGGGRSRR